MRAAGIAAWLPFSEPLEARVRHAYLDLKRIPSWGVGQALFTASEAARVPFRRQDGTPATRAEILDEYARLEANGCGRWQPGEDPLHCRWAGTGKLCLAHCHDHVGETAKIMHLRVTDADIDAAVFAKLASNEQTLIERAPNFPTMPTDAQVFLHSWAWAAGAHAAYPRMFDALRAGEYAEAAKECALTPRIGTIPLRNARNVLLLQNAARVVADELDPDVLYWPKVLASPSERQTVPMLPDDGPESEPTLEIDGGAARRAMTSEAARGQGPDTPPDEAA